MILNESACNSWFLIANPVFRKILVFEPSSKMLSTKQNRIFELQTSILKKNVTYKVYFLFATRYSQSQLINLVVFPSSGQTLISMSNFGSIPSDFKILETAITPEKFEIFSCFFYIWVRIHRSQKST